MKKVEICWWNICHFLSGYLPRFCLRMLSSLKVIETHLSKAAAVFECQATKTLQLNSGKRKGNPHIFALEKLSSFERFYSQFFPTHFDDNAVLKIILVLLILVR